MVVVREHGKIIKMKKNYCNNHIQTRLHISQVQIMK